MAHYAIGRYGQRIQVREFVLREVEDMRQQMHDDPHSEPEPNAYAFNRMTADERYYVASELGL
jgi:hypothetical protein